MEFTEGFQRLPPEAGVPFDGFGFAKIQSRQGVVSEIHTFLRYCLKEARSTAVRVLLGEWGEGKSEAFVRHIRPEVEKEKHSAFTVDAKSVSNAYRQIEPLSPVPSHQFLAAVLLALRSQDKRVPVPPLERYAGMEAWLPKAVEEITSSGKRKVFVFVDEYEDLILEPDSLRKLMAGLKAVINGQFQPIAEGGPFQGSIFFFLSCTPDAYTKMRNDPEISQVFGSYDRRVNVINLPPVSATEGIRFLWDLLLYAYDHKLPTPLPVKSSGILYTFYTIGKGNIGALVSLFSRLFNRVLTKDGKVRVLEFETMMELLPAERVSVLGSTYPGIEKQYLDGILKRFEEAKLSKECHRVFRLLVGELQPFDLPTVASRVRTNEQYAGIVVETINATLQNVGISPGILRMVEMQPNWDLRSVFVDFMHEDRISLGEFSGSADDLKANLCFWVLSGNELAPRFFFPADPKSIRAFFRGVSLDDATKIAKRLPPQTDQTPFVCASPDLVAQLYPTPAPPELAYVKDRELKGRVWRKLASDFENSFKELTPGAFLTTLSEFHDLPFSIQSISPFGRGLTFQIFEEQRGIRVSAYAEACMGDIGLDTVGSIQKLLERRTSPIHTVWVFHTGEKVLEQKTEDKYESVWERLLPVYCHPVLAKRVLAAHIFCKTHREEINPTFLQPALRDLVVQELGILRRWKDWLSNATRTGLAVQDFERVTARTEKDLADAMKFFINRIGENQTIDSVYDENVELRRLTVFNTKVGLIPDIESRDQLRNLTNDLQANRLVKVSQSSIQIVANAVEQRILGLLKEQRPYAIDEIEAEFMMVAANKRIIERVYLPLLEFKGRVAKERQAFKRTDRVSVLRDLDQRWARYEKHTEAFRGSGSPEDAHVYVSKRRENRLITLANFDQCIRREKDKITLEKPDDFVFAKTRLLQMLLDVFDTDLKPRFQVASAKMRELRVFAETEMNLARDDITRIRDDFERWTGFTFDIATVREFRILEEKQSQLRETLETQFSEQQLCDLADYVELDRFNHEHWDEEDRSFNVKVEYAQQLIGDVVAARNRLCSQIETITGLTQDLEKQVTEIQSRISTFVLSPKLILTQTFVGYIKGGLSRLQVGKRKQKLNEWTYELTLQEIETEIRKEYGKEAGQVWTLLQLSGIVASLASAETRFVEQSEDCQQMVKRACNSIDVEPYRQQREKEVGILHGMVSRYQTLYKEIETLACTEKEASSLPFLEIVRTLNNFTLDLPTVERGLHNLWNKFKTDAERDIQVLLRGIALLEKHRLDPRVSILHAEVTSLLGELERSTFSVTSKRMSDFLAVIEHVRSRFRLIILALLSNTELKVFEALISELVEPNVWMSREELIDKIGKSTGIDAEECGRSLDSLCDRGMLIKGIRLAT